MPVLVRVISVLKSGSELVESGRALFSEDIDEVATELACSLLGLDDDVTDDVTSLMASDWSVV